MPVDCQPGSGARDEMTDERDPDLDLAAAHLRPAQRGEPRPDGAMPAASGELVPWEEPRRGGLAAAFFVTWWRLASSPVAAYAALPPGGDRRRPLTFALLCGAVFGVSSELIDSATVALLHMGGAGAPAAQWLQLDIAGRSLEWLPISFLSVAGCLLALIVVAPLYLLAYSLLVAASMAVVHGLLKLTGGLRASTAGFQGTLRAVCYSQAAMAVAVIPWVGDPLAILWSFALQVVGLASAHRCSRGRAGLAVGLLAAALVLGLVLAVLLAGPDGAAG